MRVFISWSGDRSKKVAELLKWWLKCVIQASDPWVSSQSIDRGALWFPAINEELSSTAVGIVCLTKENKEKPWILFETGALAKGLSSSRVCTFLIDLEPHHLDPPLSEFNHTFPNKEGLGLLVTTINGTLKEKALPEVVLAKVFETYWPQFDDEFKKILAGTKEAKIEEKKEPDMIREVLGIVRDVERRLNAIETPKKGALFFDVKPTIITSESIENLVQTAKQYLREGSTVNEIEYALRGLGISKLSTARIIERATQLPIS